MKGILMKALLVGATGTIGSAVARLLKQHGVEVIGAHRKSTPPLDITSPASIAAFYAQLGQVDAVICTAGAAGFNSLGKLSDEDVELSVRSKLLGQVNLVRKGLDHLNPGGVFILTGGVLAYSPLPKTSMIALVNGGLESFARAAALDLTDGRRIVVVHPDWVDVTAAKAGVQLPNLPTADETATAYWQALDGATTGEPVFVAGHAPRGKA
jgi:NAD(P)-dependent dehydrogenase (short-subunit alcohol dehydrogenase family)